MTLGNLQLWKKTQSRFFNLVLKGSRFGIILSHMSMIWKHLVANVQDSQIWEDLEFFSNHKLELDKTAVIPVYPTNNVVRKKNFHKKSIKKNYSRK